MRKYTAAIALLLVEHNAEAVKLLQQSNVEFIDEVAKALAEEEEKDLARGTNLAENGVECNPCYDSKQGINHHWSWYKDNAKALKDNATDPKTITTDHRETMNDATVPKTGIP